MPIKFQKWITRSNLQQNPEWRYVFGDNLERVGLGGQAKEMRGEPNAIGVATKFRPSLADRDFFADIGECVMYVMTDLKKVEKELQAGRVVVFPEDGLGTGLSQLPQRAPKLNVVLKRAIEDLADRYGTIA